MTQQKSELYFLLILLASFFVVSFFIFKPFLYSLVLAIVFATVFYPVYKKILSLTKNRESLASFLTTAFILLVAIIPVAFLSVQVFQETTSLYSSLVDNGGTAQISKVLNTIMHNLSGSFNLPVDLSIDFKSYMKSGLSWLISNFGSIFTNVTKIVVDIFIFLITLFYVFKDGIRLKESIIKLSPLSDIHDETIFKKLGLAINSVIKGSLVVATLQGIMTATGFYIFGVSNPILWGSVAVIAALVPNVGTSLVLIPGILYLYFNGEMLNAVGLLIWGITAVGLIDNYLGPKLSGRGMQIHPVLILLSILGGISFFGPIGFVLGPISIAIFFVLTEIYFSISKSSNNAK